MHPREARIAAFKAMDEADRLADHLQRRVSDKEQALVRELRAAIGLAMARLKEVRP